MRLRLIVDVAYFPHGVPEAVLREKLDHLVKLAAGDGLFTGHSAAEVDVWEHRVETLPPTGPGVQRLESLAPGMAALLQSIVNDCEAFLAGSDMPADDLIKGIGEAAAPYSGLLLAPGQCRWCMKIGSECKCDGETEFKETPDEVADTPH
jgi:hypothetical protein